LQAQAKKSQEKIEYIQSHQTAYDWFANFAFSEVDGIPYIALKLLPKLAPELWGAKKTFLMPWVCLPMSGRNLTRLRAASV